jgi:phage terminase large subunit
VKVESKKDLAKSTREGGAMSSPNLADAFVMCFAPSDGMSLNISASAIKQAMIKK